jgi:uncharacterized coiled-coil DUF342 family protein
MENKKIAQKIIAFHKSMFDNTFNSLGILQEQTEKMVQMYLGQATWIPADGRKLINEWVAKYKKGRDDFKTTADKNYKKVEDYFKSNDAKPAPKAKATKAK